MATTNHIKFGDNLDVTDEGSGVIRVDASPAAGGGTPADATTTTKGIVQLAGDLTGTAASPQIAALAVTDAEVAAANKDGTAATPSMRTLGTGANQAAPGNDTRFNPGKVTVGLLSAGPPASPATGDIWIAMGVGGLIVNWQFMYNGGSASVYKWELIGGGPWSGFQGDAPSCTVANTIFLVGPSFGFLRAGEYQLAFGSNANCSSAAAVTLHTLVEHTTLGRYYDAWSTIPVANGWTLGGGSILATFSAGQQVDQGMYASVAGTTFTSRWLTVLARRIA